MDNHQLVDGLRALASRCTFLSEPDRVQVTELLEANELGVALEWIADAAREAGAALEPSLLELMLRLAGAMGIEASVRERLG